RPHAARAPAARGHRRRVPPEARRAEGPGLDLRRRRPAAGSVGGPAACRAGSLFRACRAVCLGGCVRFRTGDRVAVRSREEILATLDRSGEIDCMPFMAEMLQYCGREFAVGAVAHKTCDTINKTG